MHILRGDALWRCWNGSLAMLESSSRFAKLRDENITLLYVSTPSLSPVIAWSHVYVCHSFDCRHYNQSIHSFPKDNIRSTSDLPTTTFIRRRVVGGS
ncbi:hypothetical protein GQ43DRAFT_317189 [Delitschia confertaspora ATCC 74209]|uniref:Uncharacterized protein n=1 Tax=Delitschia confertaspora ATCC 74209 TaxID=1513339 RepID=A0A9P4MQW2_9PLEO|nr:hypothetical protein GQ43DRAFT_317189 [Delitschia confertaspora ATCC 74209]